MSCDTWAETVPTELWQEHSSVHEEPASGCSSWLTGWVCCGGERFRQVPPIWPFSSGTTCFCLERDTSSELCPDGSCSLSRPLYQSLLPALENRSLTLSAPDLQTLSPVVSAAHQPVPSPSLCPHAPPQLRSPSGYPGPLLEVVMLVTSLPVLVTFPVTGANARHWHLRRRGLFRLSLLIHNRSAPWQEGMLDGLL